MRILFLLLVAAALSASPLPLSWPHDLSVARADDDDDGDDGGDDDDGDDGGEEGRGGDDGDAGEADGGDDDGGWGGDDDDGWDGGGDDHDGWGDDGDDDDRDGTEDDEDEDDYEDDDDWEMQEDDEEDDDEDDDRRAGRSVVDQVLGDLRDLFGREEGENSEAAPREIVGLGLSDPALRALEARGFRSLSRRTLSGIGDVLHRIAIPAALDRGAALDEARSVAPEADFDLNHLYRGGAATDCAGPACWPLEAIAAAPLPADACARGAPVAIIDTPVDVAHPALRGATVERRSFLEDDYRAASPDHGTAVAALLVGRPAPGVAPLAPGAPLLAAEAFALRDGEERADAASILAALDWALTRRARVIGMSLAGPENRLIARGVRLAARRANVLAAAGNFGPSAPPAHPAALPEVTAVAAVDARRRAWRGGNRGDYVELAAPGVGVVSAGPGGASAEWTGTSFAVPFAVAAALRARAETEGDPAAARRLLAERAADLGAPGRDPVFGYGLVRVEGGRCW